ncbi:MAG: pyridoxamine 5'-phosphate oxidase [Bacteroidia bacterium]
MKDLKEYISRLRYDFSKRSLDEAMLKEDPLIQFEAWFREAVNAPAQSPNAMVISTATKEGKPSARIVLLRNFNEEGFVFYTNYQSKKADELQENPKAALTFFWPELERQVRIEGTIEKQNGKESDEYFLMRPDGSKLGAWSSPQSRVIKNRNILEENYTKKEEEFKGGLIPRPPYWGGYVLKPCFFEFWQGRPNRMHDRLSYTLIEEKWKIERLAP